MSDRIEYTGPQTEQAYLNWLLAEYPWSQEFQPNSLWRLDGKLHQVVGYCLLGDEPAVKIVPLPTPPYEELERHVKDIDVKRFRQQAVRVTS